MRATTTILTLLTVGAQSFSDAEIHQYDGYEQQYQQFSSPSYQNDGASYQDYASSPRASDTGFDGIHLPGINVDPNGIHPSGMHDFGMNKPEASFEGVLPWFFQQEGTPPETCGESSLTPSQYYSLICSHLNKQEREIIPGYKVRFLCDIYGGHNGKQLPANTPERCAQLCEIDSSCIGSSWFSDKKSCILSGPLGAGFREHTMYMHRIVETARQADPFADDTSDPESAEKLAECARQQEGYLNQLNQCRRRSIEAEQEFENQLSIYSTEKSIIKRQLSQCDAEKSVIKNELHQRNTDKANSEVLQVQLSSCQTQQETLQTQLNQCKDEQVARPFKSCPLDSGKKAVQGHSTYTVWCSRYDIKAVHITGMRYSAVSLQDCLLKCNGNSKCNYVNYTWGSQICWGYNLVLDPTKEPPTVSNAGNFLVAIRDT